MSKSCTNPVSLLTFLLTIFTLASSPIRPTEAKDAEQVAGEYLDLARKIAQGTSGDSARILEDAPEMLKDLLEKLRDHEDAGKLLNTIPAHMVRDRDHVRLVRQEDIFEVVFELGAAADNLRAAKAWSDLAVREERVNFANAKKQVKAQNRAEIARVYNEMQARIQDRETAAMQLWALASGRAVVRVTETNSSSSRVRAATSQETQQFAANLLQRANASIVVAPPYRSRVRDIFSLEQLNVNEKTCEAVTSLKNQIEGELRRFKKIHIEACQKALASKNETEQCRAMMSLGWWNGPKERAVVEAALKHESVTVKNTAFAVLHRLRPSPDALKRLAKKDSMEIRREAAILAGECVDDTEGVDDKETVLKEALDVARGLTTDPKPEVRQAAYASLNSLLAISNSTPLRALSFSETALKSQKTEIRLEAIQWISLLDGSGDSAFADQKSKLLVPLTRDKNKNEDTRTAARGALQ